MLCIWNLKLCQMIFHTALLELILWLWKKIFEDMFLRIWPGNGRKHSSNLSLDLALLKIMLKNDHKRCFDMQHMSKTMIMYWFWSSIWRNYVWPSFLMTSLIGAWARHNMCKRLQGMLWEAFWRKIKGQVHLVCKRPNPVFVTHYEQSTDATMVCTTNEALYFKSLIGIMQWMIDILERFDIATETSLSLLLSNQRMPQETYIHVMSSLVLKHHPVFVFEPTYPALGVCVNLTNLINLNNITAMVKLRKLYLPMYPRHLNWILSLILDILSGWIRH